MDINSLLLLLLQFHNGTNQDCICGSGDRLTQRKLRMTESGENPLDINDFSISVAPKSQCCAVFAVDSSHDIKATLQSLFWLLQVPGSGSARFGTIDTCQVLSKAGVFTPDIEKSINCLLAAKRSAIKLTGYVASATMLENNDFVYKVPIRRFQTVTLRIDWPVTLPTNDSPLKIKCFVSFAHKPLTDFSTAEYSFCQTKMDGFEEAHLCPEAIISGKLSMDVLPRDTVTSSIVHTFLVNCLIPGYYSIRVGVYVDKSWYLLPKAVVLHASLLFHSV